MTTVVSTALPDVELASGTTITVSLDVANAKVTKLNVYGPAGTLIPVEEVPKVPPLFAYAENT